MNFFNTRYYCNGYSHCQRVRGRKAEFFTIYPQNGTILRLGSDPKEPNTAAPARASGREYDRSPDRERSRRADRRSFGRLAPSHRLKPSPHVDYEGFHVHFGDRSPEKIARCRQCRPMLRANFLRGRVGWTNMKLPATTTMARERDAFAPSEWRSRGRAVVLIRFGARFAPQAPPR